MHRDSTGSLTRNGDTEKDSKENGQQKKQSQPRQSNPPPPPDPMPSTSWGGRFYKICTDPLRKAVSQNRRRLICDDFNLDLTYITDRIIAFGYPADDFEKFYRNTMEDTQRFLNRVHPDHYKVFNLRGKFFYDPQKFGGRVVSFEMMDHHPPRLEFMAQFCREAEHYLREDPLNVIAVHCKAGKGRTGVMICAYLVYINFYPKPRSIMDYYSIVRTTNNKGVTIPSQRRYIYYFHHLRTNQLNYMPLRVELVGIYLECPRDNGSRDLGIRVSIGNARVFRGAKISPEGSWNQEYEHWKGCRRDSADSINFSENFYDGPAEKNVISRRAYGWTVDEKQRVFIEGDVRVDIYHESPVGKEKLGHVWFNTMFVCHGYCSTHYLHGDEQDRYEEDCTSISTKKASSKPAPLASRAESARVKSRESEDRMAPSTSRSSSESNVRKKSKDEKKNGSWQEEYQIIEPPGLEKHCPASSLPSLHTLLKPPRDRNREFLIDAHERGIVNDDYHERRGRITKDHVETTPVVAAAPERERTLFAGGPFLLRRKPAEHVQCFPTYEIDRAIKKGTLADECKLLVVTRCIDPNNVELQSMAAVFVERCEAEQGKKDKKTHEKERKLRVSTEERENIYCVPGSGAPADDARASDGRMKKFFTLQRQDSMSRYPDVNFRCPLLPGAASIDSSQLARPQTAVGPVEMTRDEADDLKKRCSSDSSETSGGSSSSTSDEANGCD